MKKLPEDDHFEQKFNDWLKSEPEPLQGDRSRLSADRILRQEKMRLWSHRGVGLLGAVAAVWVLVFFLSPLLTETTTGEIALTEEVDPSEEVWTESDEALTNLFILEDQLAGLDWEADEDDELLAYLLFPNS